MWNDNKLIETLKRGGVVVMPTDTIYGIVGRALDPSVVNRIYEIRKRKPEKPCIVLIGDISELEKFSISLSSEQKEKIKEYWLDNSKPVSIVLECEDETFSYLHRGTKTLAIRLPFSKELQDLLLDIGPLVAPSANPEGLAPATNITEAQKYFSDSVDMYVDGGDMHGKPSKLIQLHKDGSVTILRE
jgi:L-threonylcarbamoyladenylate synthase